MRREREDSRMIICTSGISVAGGCPTPTREQIGARMNALRAEFTGSSFPNKASAETNTLSALGVTPNDEIHLLCTDTDASQICAEAVKALVEEMSGSTVAVHRIAGLQVDDPVKFRTRGIPELFRIMDSLKDKAQGREVVLNPTGGYKSVVPYMILYGQLERLRAVYLHELSTHLLELPVIPIEYDLTLFGRAESAILEMDRQTAMEEDEFFALIPSLGHEERNSFRYLIEPIDGKHVTLSVFGLHLLGLMKHGEGTVFLSSKARKSLDESSGAARDQLVFMLDRMSSPLYRRSKIDPWVNLGSLLVHKPGNTAERAVYYERGGSVYVCALWTDHGDYLRGTSGLRIEDFPVADFTPWVKPVQAEEPRELDYNRVLLSRVDRAEAAMAEMRDLMDQTVESRVGDVIRRNREILEENKKLAGDLETLQERYEKDMKESKDLHEKRERQLLEDLRSAKLEAADLRLEVQTLQRTMEQEASRESNDDDQSA